MGGAVAAIAAAKQQQIVQAFITARATSVNAGRSLADLGVGDDRLFRGLVRRNLIREASPGTFYLDEAAWETDRRRRLALALIMAGLIAIVGIATALYNRP